MTLKNKKILVVDDTPFHLDRACALARNWGMETFAAEDGVDALEILAGQDVDVCLLDIQMPRMDGFQTAIEIRKKYGRRFPIISATALGPSVKPDCLECGMDDYIHKPYADEELKSILTEWTDNYRNS